MNTATGSPRSNPSEPPLDNNRSIKLDEGRVVVLPDGEHVEPLLVCEPRDLDGGPDALVLGGGAPGGGVGGHVADAEDSELHVFLSDESKLIEL